MKLRILMIPAGALCLFMSSGAFGADDQDRSAMDAIKETAKDLTQTDRSRNVLTEVKVRDLNKKPDRFSGHDVMVNGKVSRIEGPNAFILEGSGLFNNKILVVVSKPAEQAGKSGQRPGTAAPVIRENERVQLVGRVEELGITRIEEKYKPGLKAEIKAEFEGKMPVLIVPPSGIKTQS